jgi:ABC-type multidrug transport system ATPase subunit
MAKRTATVCISGLNRAFGSYQALNDVSCTVFSGEILGLIGPNGAGKTTLLECISGLLPIDSGRVDWLGRELAPEERKQWFWFQPDNITPFAGQAIGVTLSFFQQVHGAGQERLDSLIRQLELASMLHKPLQALSKGYRRRVLLGIALLSSQPLLMLDEPFDGFDLRQSLAVMDLLRDNLSGRTMILSIHQLSEAEKICDRFLLLDQGQVKGTGTLEDLRRRAGLAPGTGLEEVFLALT